MAIVKIHAIKNSPALALDYIENPEKTEQQLLVSGYNVDPLSASIEFAMTDALAKEINGDYTKTGGANNKAYHMIQSFAPFDSLTPEEAHELGKQWADEVLDGKHEYVISTHVDKGQIHNHIIFNATSFYDHKKFESIPYKTIARLRSISDRLCEENDLFVPRFRRRGKDESRKYPYGHSTSQKERLEHIINIAIYQCNTYDDFKKFLAVMKVDVKEQKKNISFKMPGNTRFCRGKSIGEAFTFENIVKRLAEPDKKLPRTKSKSKRSSQHDGQSFDEDFAMKSKHSKLASLQAIAESLEVIRSENLTDYNSIETKISTLKEQAARLSEKLADNKVKGEKFQRVAKYLKAYKDYLPIAQTSAGKLIGKGGYDIKYENELRAFNHAASQLEKMGVDPTTDIDKVLALVEQQEKNSKRIRENIVKASARIGKLEKTKQTIDMVSSEDVQDVPVTETKKTERGMENAN